MLRAAAHHKGSAFVEIYQNCNIYNDGAFDFVREQKENRIYLRHGEPITLGRPRPGEGRAAAPDGSPEVVDASAERAARPRRARHRAGARVRALPH